MNLSWLFFAVALLVGALITVQTGSNAAGMGRIVGCLLMVAGFFLIARF
jgi:uncharacterized membrane protein YdcZ (DUF606 family)